MKKQLKKYLQLHRVICYTYPAIEQEAITKELSQVANDLDVSINQILLTENLDFSIQNKGLYLLPHFNSLLAGLSGWQAINLEKWLLTLVTQCQQEPNTYLILLDHQGSDLPRYLNSIIPTLIHELPSIPQIQDVIKQVFAEMGVASLDNEKMALAVSGLSLKEIELALKEAILQKGEIIENLIWQKQRFLQGLGLEFLPPPDVPTFGGLNRIKEAIEQVALDYSEEARQFKLPFPKGWLFAGPPGTGKTFGAKICAAKLGFPLISVGVDIVKSKGSNYLKHLLKLSHSPN